MVPAHTPGPVSFYKAQDRVKVNIEEFAKQHFVPCSLLFLAGSCLSVTCHYCDAGRHNFRDGQPNESLRHNTRYSTLLAFVRYRTANQRWETLCTVTCTTAAVDDRKCSALQAYQGILSGQVAAAQEDSSCQRETDRWSVVLQGTDL